MAKRKKPKGQTMIYKTLHGKLSNKNPLRNWMSLVALEG
jgi:hypothetical protein